MHCLRQQSWRHLVADSVRVQRQPPIGLDIGSSARQSRAIGARRAGLVARSGARSPCPGVPFMTGLIDAGGLVSETVSQLLDSMRLRRARRQRAALGHAVIVKRLTLPAMSEAELDDAIPWEAEQHIPFDLSGRPARLRSRWATQRRDGGPQDDARRPARGRRRSDSIDDAPASSPTRGATAGHRHRASPCATPTDEQPRGTAAG